MRCLLALTHTHNAKCCNVYLIQLNFLWPPLTPGCLYLTMGMNISHASAMISLKNIAPTDEGGNPLGLCLSLCLSLTGFFGADETF